MPPLDKNGEPDWDRMQNAREKKIQKYGIIAVVVVVLLTVIMLLSRGHLGTVFSQLSLPESVDGNVITRDGELDERDIEIVRDRPIVEKAP